MNAAERNRALHPWLAWFVDQFRNNGYPNCQLIDGDDKNGRKLGKCPDYWPKDWPADGEERN